MAGAGRTRFGAAVGALPVGTIPVGIGLLVSGLAAYGFQIIAFRILGSEPYAALNGLCTQESIASNCFLNCFL